MLHLGFQLPLDLAASRRWAKSLPQMIMLSKMNGWSFLGSQQPLITIQPQYVPMYRDQIYVPSTTCVFFAFWVSGFY